MIEPANPFMPSSIESEARDVLTAEDVARYLRLRASTVADLARRGELPSVKFGRARRYLRADVLEYVRKQREPARSES